MPVLERCVHRLTEEHDRVRVTITVDHHQGETGRPGGSADSVEEVLGRPVSREA